MRFPPNYLRLSVEFVCDTIFFFTFILANNQKNFFWIPSNIYDKIRLCSLYGGTKLGARKIVHQIWNINIWLLFVLYVKG